MKTEWRASGLFRASSALFSGILEETQLFLQTYADQTGSLDERVQFAKRILVEGRLPQRSRSSRESIVDRITRRVIYWGPPPWVLDDLASYASDPSLLALKAALLMHVCRQDRLLYSLVQDVIVPMWDGSQYWIDSSDVQRYLDGAVHQHPEIDSWTRQTRQRIGSTTLSILRDYGLLRGKTRKQIVEPIVPNEAVTHVVKLLRAEGIAEQEIPVHSDWRLWLWDEAHTRARLRSHPCEDRSTL